MNNKTPSPRPSPTRGEGGAFRRTKCRGRRSWVGTGVWYFCPPYSSRAREPRFLGHRVRGALSFGSFLWVRKERTPPYGGGCAGKRRASGARLARLNGLAMGEPETCQGSSELLAQRTGRPRRVCPGLPSAAGKRSAGRRAQDLQARARRAKRRKPVSEQSPSGDTFMKSTQTP